MPSDGTLTAYRPASWPDPFDTGEVAWFGLHRSADEVRRYVEALDLASRCAEELLQVKAAVAMARAVTGITAVEEATR